MIGALIQVGIFLAVLFAPAMLWRRYVDAPAPQGVLDAITLTWLAVIVTLLVWAQLARWVRRRQARRRRAETRRLERELLRGLRRRRELV